MKEHTLISPGGHHLVKSLPVISLSDNSSANLSVNSRNSADFDQFLAVVSLQYGGGIDNQAFSEARNPPGKLQAVSFMRIDSFQNTDRILRIKINRQSMKKYSKSSR